uniref:Odorant-binding protein OBP11 n=1 Tax=Lobesia botrana TaxID=209534 RepID=A0A345BEQ2_9NEOP|nr:odorant-binding protein OBP11 [Lobesia botrana]
MERYGVIFCAVVALSVVGINCMDDEMAELAAMLRESCAEETGVDLGLVEKVNAGADLMPDPKLKCYTKCVMETAGMLSDGEVDVEAVIALLPDDMRVKTEKHIRGCGTKKGADDCETAFLTQINQPNLINKLFTSDIEAPRPHCNKLLLVNQLVLDVYSNHDHLISNKCEL